MRLYKTKRLSDSDFEFPTGCGNVSHCQQPVADRDKGEGRGEGRHPVPEIRSGPVLKKKFQSSGPQLGSKLRDSNKKNEKIGINLGLWETAHLPLPLANVLP